MKKTKKTEVTIVTEQPKSWWQKTKDWFYNSESIFLASITSAVGAVTTTVTGILSSTDFTSILSSLQSGLHFNKEQLMVMGLGAVGLGVLQYWTRIRGTKTVDGNLLPKAY